MSTEAYHAIKTTSATVGSIHNTVTCPVRDLSSPQID